MELAISHLDSLIEESTAASDIESVRMLDLDVDSVQVLIPHERWGDFDRHILLLVDQIEQRVIFGLDDLTRFTSCCHGCLCLISWQDIKCVASCNEIVHLNQLLNALNSELTDCIGSLGG